MRAHTDSSIDTSTTQKEAATTFLTMVASGDVKAAFDRYASPHFRHHNVYFPADAKSLADAMQKNANQFPEKSLRVVKAIEDGDHVAVFSAVCHEPGASEFAVVHIFRFDDDKIAELWDVAQEAPKNSPNLIGAF